MKKFYREFSVRTMQWEDIDKVAEWVAAEGWNPSLNDIEAFRVADPAGLLVGCINAEPVAAIAAIKYENSFGFLGFYIVRSDMRGQGLGYPVWQAGMTHLEGCIIGLDAVVAQQSNYARSGFTIAHSNVRYWGTPKIDTNSNPELQTIGPDLLNRVIAYDQPFFPARREQFLRHWLNHPLHYAIAYVEEGEVKGYGVIRTAQNGFKIGPLFADDPDKAQDIFQALCQRTGGQPVILDVPQPNHSATRLAVSYGLTPLFETARMYRGEAPGLPLDNIFGMSTLEIG